MTGNAGGRLDAPPGTTYRSRTRFSGDQRVFFFALWVEGQGCAEDAEEEAGGAGDGELSAGEGGGGLGGVVGLGIGIPENVLSYIIPKGRFPVNFRTTFPPATPPAPQRASVNGGRICIAFFDYILSPVPISAKKSPPDHADAQSGDYICRRKGQMIIAAALFFLQDTTEYLCG